MPIYIEYVVNNQQSVRDLLAKVERKLIAKFGMENEERFWRGLLTVCITGAMLAKKLDIINHDVNALLPAAFAHFEYQRAVMSEEVKNDHALYQFVQDIQSSVLVVDTDAPTITARGNPMVTAHRKPAAHVNVRMRYINDSGRLYVDRKFLRAYCSEKNLDFRQLVATAEQEGWLVQDQERRDLAAYTYLDTPARVICICFDMHKAKSVVSLLKGA